jgi:hypothetical protein
MQARRSLHAADPVKPEPRLTRYGGGKRMENKIEPLAAELELQRIIDFWEVDPEGEDWEDSKRRLLQAIQKGRITLDESAGQIIVELVAPVELKTGETIRKLAFKEPTAGDLRVFDKYKDGEKMAKSIHLASRMTGQPTTVIEGMGSRDVSTMGAVASLFF